MRESKRWFFAIGLAALTTLPECCYATLVKNGDFELGDFEGWTLTPNPGDFSFEVYVGADYPHSGTYAADLGKIGSISLLSQTIDTMPGVPYTLTYWLQNQGTTPTEFFVKWQGAMIAGSRLTNPDEFDYREYTFALQATGNSALLEFGSRNDSGYWHLDDVSVTAVPEPGYYGVLAVILLLAFGARRRQRRVLPPKP
jgi:MYXO-CTERM domain-containing protein